MSEHDQAPLAALPPWERVEEVAAALLSEGAIVHALDDDPRAPDLLTSRAGELHTWTLATPRQDGDRSKAQARRRWLEHGCPGWFTRIVRSPMEAAAAITNHPAQNEDWMLAPPAVTHFMCCLIGLADGKLQLVTDSNELAERLRVVPHRARALTHTAERMGLVDVVREHTGRRDRPHRMRIRILSTLRVNRIRDFLKAKAKRPSWCANCLKAIADSINDPKLCSSCYQKVGRKDRAWRREAIKLSKQGLGYMSIYTRLSKRKAEDGTQLWDVHLFPKPSGANSKSQTSLVEVLIDAGMDQDGTLERALHQWKKDLGEA